jgi:hypothetical protein
MLEFCAGATGWEGGGGEAPAVSAGSSQLQSFGLISPPLSTQYPKWVA